VRLELPCGLLGVQGLDAQKNGVPDACDLAGLGKRQGLRERFDRPGDGEAALANGPHMRGV